MKTPAFGALRVEELPWRRILLFALLGALSGALSAFTAFLVFPPGFIFGVVFTPLLVRRGLLSPLRALPWLACATFGHLVAADSLTDVSGWLHAFSPIPEPPAIMLAGLVAGALGGGVLAAATRLLIPGTRWLIPTAVGAALGPLVLALYHPMIGEPFAMLDIFGPHIFYMTWQSGYAAALALALPTPTTGGEIAT